MKFKEIRNYLEYYDNLTKVKESYEHQLENNKGLNPKLKFPNIGQAKYNFRNVNQQLHYFHHNFISNFKPNSRRLQILKSSQVIVITYFIDIFTAI